MKRTITIICCFLAISFHTYAQDDAAIPGGSSSSTKSSEGPKGFIHFSAGSSISAGDFGETSSGNAAIAGFASNGLNFGLNGGYAFAKGFGISAIWFGGAHFTEIDGVSYTTEDDIWSYGAIGAGPMYMGSSGKLVYTAQLNIASFLTYVPYWLTDPFVDVNARSLGVVVGGSLKYAFGKFAVGTNIDYFATNPDFTDLGWSQSVSGLNLNLNIGLVF